MTVKFGLLGDSALDSYRGSDNRGSPYEVYTYGSSDLLVAVRNFDLGAWGSYGEPRRIDYAHNWARSAATASGMISQGQHTGLAAQISNGDVEYAFIGIGGNDFNPNTSTEFNQIYNGTLTGGSLTTWLSSIVNNVDTALTTLLNAGALGVVGTTLPIIDEALLIAMGYTDAAGRQRVKDAVITVNSGLIDLYGSNSQPISLPSFYTGDGTPTTGAFPNRIYDLWGMEIDYDVQGNEPHNGVLNDEHPGTVRAALRANIAIITPLREALGLDVKPIMPWEILELIGDTGPRGSIRKALA